MSNYAWFAVKGICYLVLIGYVSWLTNSAWCLWALLLMPSFNDDEKNKDKK